MGMKIEVDGIKMEVKFEYTAPEPTTRHCLGMVETAEIETVLVGGQDIFDLLADYAIEAIEAEILTQLDKEAENGL